MAAHHVSPETPEERLIFWAIVGTWGLWLLGLPYIVYPLLGWGLAAIGLARRLELMAAAPKDRVALASGVWLWIGGMLVLLLALLAGHIDYELGALKTLKSAIGWMKGWALIAIFMFAGACLRIRPAVIYRASNILALQMLIVTPLFVAAALAGVPKVFYTSPAMMLGGGGQEFFDVGPYLSDPGSLGFRLRYYAPWSPAAALIANIGFVLALYDKSAFWRCTGIAAAIVVSFMSQSRSALVVLPVVIVVIPLLSTLARSKALAIGAIVLTVAVLSLDQLTTMTQDLTAAFADARADSSRVRATLQRIALHRWANEAPWFGHGIVERGPQLVEYMPIGSHHTWFGLLFVKGLVGFLALAVPMVWSLLELIGKAQADRTARASLGVLLVIMLYSFGENLEILTYLMFPALILVGIAMQRRFVNPWRARLGARPETAERQPGFPTHVYQSLTGGYVPERV